MNAQFELYTVFVFAALLNIKEHNSLFSFIYSHHLHRRYCFK
jgi:hypothetical protein